MKRIIILLLIFIGCFFFWGCDNSNERDDQLMPTEELDESPNDEEDNSDNDNEEGQNNEEDEEKQQETESTGWLPSV